MSAGYYSYQCLALNPTRYHRLNEASGSVAYDYSTELINSTYIGSPSLGQPSIINDPTGGSVLLNGSSQYITLNSTTGLPTGNQVWTTLGWGYLTAVPSIAAIFLELGFASGVQSAYVQVLNGTPDPSLSTNGTVNSNGTTAIPLNTPFLIALQWDGTHLNGFIYHTAQTGLFVQQSYASINITYGNFYFGTNVGTPAHFWSGRMAEIAVFESVLTTNQMQGLYNAGINGAPSSTPISNNLDYYSFAAESDGPVRLYPLSDVSGSSAVDQSINAQNGTYLGGVTLGQRSLVNATPSAKFDGVTGTVQIPASGLPTGNNPWSMVSWFMQTAYQSGTTKKLMHFGNWGFTRSAPHMGVNNLGQVFVGTYAGDTTPAGSFSLNAPHLLVGTWDGTTLRCYLDGVLVATATPGALTVSGVSAYIGSVQGNTDFFAGFISGAEILNYTLSLGQITELWNHGQGMVGQPVSSNSPYQVKMQVVRVYDPTGTTFKDLWHDAPLLSGFKEALNSAPTPIKVKLPRNFDFFDEQGFGSYGTVGQGNIIQWWLYGQNLPPGGLLRYQGVIDSYEQSLTESSEEFVTVSVTPFGSTVGDGGVTTTIPMGTAGSSSTYADPLTMLRYFFLVNDPDTGLPYFSPLTLDQNTPIQSGNVSQYTWSNQGLDTVLDTIRLLLPVNWYWRVDQNLKTVLVSVPPTTAQHQFVIGKNISAPQFKKDWENLRNVVQVVGNTPSIVSTKKGTDLTTYGKRLQAIADNRVTDQNTCNALALGALAELDSVQYRFVIRVFDFRGDNQTGLGYDIETIRVGNTCQIVDPILTGDQTFWDSGTWDSSTWDFSPNPELNQVVTIVGLSYGFDYVDLELSAFAPNQDRQIIELRNDFETFSTA